MLRYPQTSLSTQHSALRTADEGGEAGGVREVGFQLGEAAEGGGIVVGDGAEVDLPVAAGAVGEEGVAGQV